MYVIAVDVGSESARACICSFDTDPISGLENSVGKVLITKKHPIPIHNVQKEYFEQSTGEIWLAVKSCIKECIEISNIDKERIKGIAFTATCSLSIVGSTLSTKNDTIMWMDHRSISIANDITKTGHSVLNQFGNVCSPEMSLAKICWIHKNKPQLFNDIHCFLELPCWLTFKSISNKLQNHESFPQSVCSVTCKWGYDAANKSWPEDLFDQIGMENWKSKICSKVFTPGERSGFICQESLQEMGFSINSNKIAVASSIIDAHAGVLGMISLYAAQSGCNSYENILSMISGTSTCIMALSKQRKSTQGVWGPYLDVILNGYHVREAGQSATGKLLDFIIQSHPDYLELSKKFITKASLSAYVSESILKLDPQRNKLVINPTYYGNRSPLANPHLRACVYGQTLEATALTDLYEAVVQGLAYEVRFIVEQMEMKNDQLKVIVSGGLTHNKLYMQTHADVLGCELIAMNTEQADMMLVGASLMARQAAMEKHLSDEDLKGIKFDGVHFDSYRPREQLRQYHEVKYRCYRKLVQASLEVNELLQEL